MKIAIQDGENSYSRDWMDYCNANFIPYKLVDCYANDIVVQMADCDALMWHWRNTDHAVALFARHLVHALEGMGKRVFPDAAMCRFFDDKIGQRYWFLAMGIPHVPTYVFYEKNAALDWAKTAGYPKIFKLSKGSGSANVQIVRSFAQAREKIGLAFSRGFRPVASYFSDAPGKMKRKRTIGNLYEALFRAPGKIKTIYRQNRLLNREKGYVYFQDFVPGNDHDFRVITVGDKAIAVKRMFRTGDYKAAGGRKQYVFDPEQIDRRCIEAALAISAQNHYQFMAYDFILADGGPLLIEMGYAVTHPDYDGCQGYWTADMIWHGGKIVICHEMVKNIVAAIGRGAG